MTLSYKMVRLPTGNSLSLSHVSNNINIEPEIWTLMNPPGILRDVEWNKKPKPKGLNLRWKKRGRIIYLSIYIYVYVRIALFSISYT